MAALHLVGNSRFIHVSRRRLSSAGALAAWIPWRRGALNLSVHQVSEVVIHAHLVVVHPHLRVYQMVDAGLEIDGVSTGVPGAGTCTRGAVPGLFMRRESGMGNAIYTLRGLF